MRILTRYIYVELIGPFFVGLGFFTFIFILNPISRLIDFFIVKQVPLKEIMLLFIYLLPSTMAIALPMATLVAVLMAYGRLSSDSEVVAMRASGVSYLRIFCPAIVFSLLISFSGIYFNDSLLPTGNFAFNKLYKEIATRKPLTQLQEHTITDIGEGRIQRYIGVDRIDDRTGLMQGVMIMEVNRDSNQKKIIVAEKGRWLDAIEKKYPDDVIMLYMRLLLENGNVQQPGDQGTEQLGNIVFNKMIINFPQKMAFSINVQKGTREKTTKEIMADIKKVSHMKKRPHRLWVEYYKRFSIPFAALAFVLVGLPFSIVSGRSGKSVSLGISIIIIFVYYLFYTMGESYGKSGKIHELLALWISNIVFIIGGSIYISRISKT